MAREPLVAFVAIGGLFFVLYALVRPADERPVLAAPPRAERTVLVDAALLERVRGSWQRAWGRAPNRDELAELLLDAVAEEVLYREALLRELDRDDPLVRRRLIEKMIVVARGPATVNEPDEAELRRWFETRRHRFVVPAQIWFEQRFIDPAVHGSEVNQVANTLLARLQKDEPDTAGDPGSLPAEVAGKTDTQVAHLFGAGFAKSVWWVHPESWQGPLSSSQGLHLVRVSRRDSATQPGFDEARASVRADYLSQKSRGLQDAVETLLPSFQLRLAPSVREAISGSPLASPLLGKGP